MKKNVIVIVVGILVLVGIAGGLYLSQKKPQVAEAPKQKIEVGAIPTVDASTLVTLTSDTASKQVILKSTNIPNGTTSVDYELSYDTKSQGKQGALGTITDIAGGSFERKILLGTCSSGHCVYHEVISAIQVTLKFTGDFGEKILSKEFSL